MHTLWFLLFIFKMARTVPRQEKLWPRLLPQTPERWGKPSVSEASKLQTAAAWPGDNSTSQETVQLERALCWELRGLVQPSLAENSLCFVDASHLLLENKGHG